MNLLGGAAISVLIAVAAAQQPPPPKFQSGVDLVEVALVVRDAAGRPVTDLRQDEVTILEKGVVQKIVAFERVSRPARSARVAAVKAPEARDTSTNEALERSRVFMLVLDALHVSNLNVPVVRTQAREFVEQHVGPNDLVAVFSAGGGAGATEDFTTDKARLLAAIERFQGTKLASSTVLREREARMGTVLHGGKDPDDFERAWRAQSLAGLLRALAANAARIDSRRKALVLFSEGTDYDLGDVMGIAQRQASDVMDSMNDAITSLMRANVTLYAIDPRKLGSSAGDLLENPVHNEFPTPGSLSSRGVEEEHASSIRNLRDLAEATGGFAAVDSNNVTAAFDRVIQESSDYYIVAFAPAMRKPGEFRQISVRTTRPGVRIVARKGYVAPTEASSGSAAAAARAGAVDAELAGLLASPLPKAGLPLRVQVIPIKVDGRKAAVRLVVEVLGAQLQFSERAGRAEERIDIALISVDDRGRAGNGRTTRMDLSLGPEDLQRVKTTGIRWLSTLELPAGRHQLRIAARATRTGSTGMVTAAVDVPVYDTAHTSMSGVTITSLPAQLMLTRGDAWKEPALPTPPTASRTFVAGDRVTAAVQSYSAAAGPEPRITAAIQPSNGPAIPLSVTRTRKGSQNRPTHEASMTFDTRTLPAGRYVLVIAVTPAAAGERVERRVPFEIVGARQG